MELKKHLKGVLSLSAASLALLQSTSSTQAKDLETITGDLSKRLHEHPSPDREKVILAPTIPDGLAQLLAAHRSHSSHSSHRSHYSSYGSGYSAPSIPSAPSSPVTAPAPAPTAYTPPAQSEESDQRALAEQKRRAAIGYAASQYSLALRYISGNGVEQSEERARLLLRLAEIQDYSMAIQKLQDMGKEVVPPERSTNSTSGPNTTVLLEKPEPPKPSFQIQMKEAATGSAEAQCEAGLRYVKGDGVGKNVERGKMLLELAEIQGNTKASALLQGMKNAEK